MKKTLFMLCCLLMSWNACAQELAGVELEDKVQLGDTPLVLNGAGVRSMWFFKIYVIGLYMAEKGHNADAIFADAKPKRIFMHIVIEDAATERFMMGFRKGVEENYSEAEVAALRERMAMFEQMFSPIKTVKRGDVIIFDSLPGEGTRVTLNGSELGRIGGDDFYRALLAIWIGGKPVNDDLKKELLGG